MHSICVCKPEKKRLTLCSFWGVQHFSWALAGPTGTQKHHSGAEGWGTFRPLSAKAALLGHQGFPGPWNWAYCGCQTDGRTSEAWERELKGRVCRGHCGAGLCHSQDGDRTHPGGLSNKACPTMAVSSVFWEPPRDLPVHSASPFLHPQHTGRAPRWQP